MVAQPDITDVLREVPDPELPVSIVDLGLVEAIRIEEHEHDTAVHVDLLPTFIGCPALDIIARDVTDRVQQLPGVSTCRVTWRFDPPWSVDRISDEGRETLAAHGVTVAGCQSGTAAPDAIVPLMTSALTCPYCGSTETRLDSPYGPTRCRSIYLCTACRNQFEHMKRAD